MVQATPPSTSMAPVGISCGRVGATLSQLVSRPRIRLVRVQFDDCIGPVVLVPLVRRRSGPGRAAVVGTSVRDVGLRTGPLRQEACMEEIVGPAPPQIVRALRECWGISWGHCVAAGALARLRSRVCVDSLPLIHLFYLRLTSPSRLHSPHVSFTLNFSSPCSYSSFFRFWFSCSDCLFRFC